MKSTIRKMLPQDKDAVFKMMQTFYASPAIFTNGSDEIFLNDIEACVSENPFLCGYIIENEAEIQGYAMIAKSFSTEFGKPCIWIEDLYLRESHRGKGLGKQMMEFILKNHTDCVFRLEAEEENKPAVTLYKKQGFTVLPYMELIKQNSKKGM